MDRSRSVVDTHLRLLVEAADDALERMATAREFAVRADAIKRDRSNPLSYSIPQA